MVEYLHAANPFILLGKKRQSKISVTAGEEQSILVEPVVVPPRTNSDKVVGM
jgi:hypothetical protein